jgi:hypothetical protein
VRIFFRKYKGQSLVEFALALPLLAVVLVGLTSFGFVLYAHVQVSNATREAARAGSLFRPNRLHYTAGAGLNGDNCWTFNQWVENAVVEFSRNATSGCPTTRNLAIHSLGFLNPRQCTATITTDCWTLTQLVYDDTNTAVPSPSTPTSRDLPEAGRPLRVELTYRYDVPFVGNVLPIINNPHVISKRVIMRFQNR